MLWKARFQTPGKPTVYHHEVTFNCAFGFFVLFCFSFLFVSSFISFHLVIYYCCSSTVVSIFLPPLPSPPQPSPSTVPLHGPFPSPRMPSPRTQWSRPSRYNSNVLMKPSQTGSIRSVHTLSYSLSLSYHWMHSTIVITSLVCLLYQAARFLGTLAECLAHGRTQHLLTEGVTRISMVGGRLKVQYHLRKQIMVYIYLSGT